MHLRPLRPLLTIVAACLLWLHSTSAFAHFLWLEAEGTPATSVQVHFSESAGPDDPELLNRIVGAELFVARRDGIEPLELKRTAETLSAEVPVEQQYARVGLADTYGVLERGGESFLLKYWGKTELSPLPGDWRAIDNADRFPLELAAQRRGGGLVITATWRGKPLPRVQIVCLGAGLEKTELTTDEQGEAAVTLKTSGRFAARIRFSEPLSGIHDEKAYTSIRHYSTLTLPYTAPEVATDDASLPALPRGITSFGAATLGGVVYVYGGHFGKPHHYSAEGQSGELLALDLNNPSGWKKLAGGPKRTGLAMVAHDGALYRLGGFEARNREDDEQELHSQADFARYVPERDTWEDLPALPAGRSSFDAAVWNGVLYVVGGWKLSGDHESTWHTTALRCDLSNPQAGWSEIAAPPFQRRALSLAAHAGRLFAIGGMQPEGGPSTRIDVYDIGSQTWTVGPALQGDGMQGFGNSAFPWRGGVCVSTLNGSIQTLDGEQKAWRLTGQMHHPRFFHRLIPAGDQLLAIGGANMKTGKIVEPELLRQDLGQATAER